MQPCTVYTKYTMLQLNNDCLLEIFRLLSLNDQVTLLDVCERFHAIICYIWTTKYHKLNTNELPWRVYTHRALDYERSKRFFGIIAPNLRELSVGPIMRMTDRDDQDLGGECIYRQAQGLLQELSFYLSYRMPQLRELESRLTVFPDCCVQLLVTHSPQLETLCVSSDCITGAHVKELRHLRQFHAPKSWLRESHMREMLTELSLTHLSVNMKSVTETFFRDMFGSIVNLNQFLLMISDDEYKDPTLDILKNFFARARSHIKELKLSNVHLTDYSIVEPISQLNRMIQLHIDSCIFPIELPIVTQFTSLKYLHFCCFDDFEQFYILLSNCVRLESVWDHNKGDVITTTTHIRKIVKLLQRQAAEDPPRTTPLTYYYMVPRNSDKKKYDTSQKLKRMLRSDAYQNQKVLKIQIEYDDDYYCTPNAFAYVRIMFHR